MRAAAEMMAAREGTMRAAAVRVAVLRAVVGPERPREEKAGAKMVGGLLGSLD